MRIRLACAALLLAAPMTATSATVAPVAGPAVSLTRTQCADFSEALAALSAQGHVALVAEGTPLKSHLTGRAVPDLSAPEPLAQAVTALASAYDYDAAKTKGGVFVLTKRYTDPKDIPDVTLPECVQAAKNVLRVLDAYNPHFQQSVYVAGPNDQRDTLIGFVASLTPDEKQAMEAKALHYGDLSPDQQTMIQRLFLYQYVQGPSDSLKTTVDNMTAEAKSVLTGQDDLGKASLCVEMTVGPDATVTTSHDGKHYMLPLYIATATPMPTQPVVPPPSQTLAAIVSGLGPVDGERPAVEADIRDLPATAVGLAGVGPMDALNALEVVYSLRIGSTPQGAPQLEMPSVPTLEGLADISADAWAALPASLTRALHLKDGSAAPIPLPTSGGEAAYQKWQQANTQRNQQRWDMMERPADLGRAAAARVWATLQPRLRTGERVSVSSLDAPTQDALAVVLMSGVMDTLYNQYGGRPNQLVLDGLDNINRMVVYSDPKETANVKGVLVPSIHMETVDPYTGELVGMGGTVYYSIP